MPEAPLTTRGAAPLIFVVAGEASGDAMAARIMAALIERTGGRVRFEGVGGAAMAQQGLQSLFPIAELSVMGLAEVLPRAPRLLKRLAQLAEAVRSLRPDLVLTVDSPGFALRLHRRLAKAGVTRVHCVAPQVWAWRPGRAKRLARLIDHLLLLFPFEVPLFERHGISCTFIGHPVVESGAGSGSAKAFRERHRLTREHTVIAVLPGSRHTEVHRLLPVFADALRLLARRRPGLVAAVPLAESVAGEVERALKDWPVPTVAIRERAERFDAFAAAACALTKSGTSTLELALSGVPMVVAYRVSAPSAALVRRLLQVREVALVNILLERALVPEFLQEACRPERLAQALEELLSNPAAIGEQRKGFEKLRRRLAPEGARPSVRAADALLALLRAETTARR